MLQFQSKYSIVYWLLSAQMRVHRAVQKINRQDEIRQDQGWEGVRDQHLRAWGGEAFPESSETSTSAFSTFFSRVIEASICGSKHNEHGTALLPAAKLFTVKLFTTSQLHYAADTIQPLHEEWAVQWKHRGESRNRRGVGDGLPQKAPLYIRRGVRRSFSFCAKRIKCLMASHRRGNEFIIALTESVRSSGCGADMAQDGMFNIQCALKLKCFCCCRSQSQGFAVLSPLSVSLSADIPSSAVGRLQGHADGLWFLQHLQHHGLPDRLWDTIPGGELQLQDGAHAR